MQLVVQSGSEPGRTYDIAASQKIRMGRQSGNDVVVPDEQVSRRHAEIEERNGGLVVTDLGSSNGTFVNGTRITSSQNLQPGDTVQVGTTVLKVVGSPASSGGAGDYDQGATQVAGFTPSTQDYGYNSPSAPSAPPSNDYGQSGGYGQSASGYGQSAPAGYDQSQGQQSYGGGSGSSYGGSSSAYDQGQGQANYGGPSSSAGSSPYGGSGSSYDQGQGQQSYGGSQAGGSSYGGSGASSGSSYGGSSPSAGYDQGQQAYGGSGSGQNAYGGSSSASAGSAYGGSSSSSSGYDPSGQGSSYGGQPSSYGQSSPGNQSAYGQGASGYDPSNPSASQNAYGGPAYDPANPSAGGYNAGQQGGYNQNAYGQGQGQQGYNQGQPAYGSQQSYGQPGQPGQYGQSPYAAPAAPAAKKGGLPLPLIIVGIVVVLLIVGALVFFFVINKGGSVGDVPAPPNSTKLDISASDIAKLNTANPELSQADINKLSYGFYASTDSASTILSFYQTEMKNRGWTQDTTVSDTTGSQFKKGDQSAGIVILPITSDAQITGLTAALPAVKDKIKVGQTLVIAASGPSNLFKTTPGA